MEVPPHLRLPVGAAFADAPAIRCRNCARRAFRWRHDAIRLYCVKCGYVGTGADLHRSMT